MVVACSYKILWPKIDFWHILACFGPFLECKNAQNWNGQPTIVYGSINLKFFLGGPDTYTKLPCEEGSPNPKFFFFGPGYCPPIYTYMAIAVFEVLEQGQHLESQPWCLSSAWLLFSQLRFVCSYIPFYCHMTIVLPALYSLDYTTCVQHTLLYVLHNIM